MRNEILGNDLNLLSIGNHMVSSSIWNWFARLNFLKNSQVQINSKLNETNRMITFAWRKCTCRVIFLEAIFQSFRTKLIKSHQSSRGFATRVYGFASKTRARNPATSAGYFALWLPLLFIRVFVRTHQPGSRMPLHAWHIPELGYRHGIRWTCRRIIHNISQAFTARMLAKLSCVQLRRQADGCRRWKYFMWTSSAVTGGEMCHVTA